MQKDNVNEEKNVIGNAENVLKESPFKTKEEEINYITTELKNHYFLEKYFVDPDKTFNVLLGKIIVRIYF